VDQAATRPELETRARGCNRGAREGKRGLGVLGCGAVLRRGAMLAFSCADLAVWRAAEAQYAESSADVGGAELSRLDEFVFRGLPAAIEAGRARRAGAGIHHAEGAGGCDALEADTWQVEVMRAPRPRTLG